jgi:phage anti-repressor protein
MGQQYRRLIINKQTFLFGMTANLKTSKHARTASQVITVKDKLISINATKDINIIFRTEFLAYFPYFQK